MSSVAKLEKAPPLRDQVYARIKKLLLHGDLERGERVTEERVAGLLDVSRTPVREALGLLAQQGILERRDKRGYTVPSPSPEEIEDYIFVREVLELTIVERAIERFDSEKEKRLVDLLAQEETVVGTADAVEFFLLTMEFWSAIWSMSESPGLIRCIEPFGDQYHFQIAAVIGLRNIDVRRHVIRDQKTLFKALHDRDVERARALISEHLGFKKKELLKALRCHDK